MKSYKNRAFRGAGSILIEAIAAATGLRRFGNASALTFGIGEDKTTQKDYTTPQGGNAASSSTIADITGSITGLSYQPDVMRVALRAIIEESGIVAIADERVTLYEDAITELEFIPNTTLAFTVTADPDGSPTTLEEGTHYNIVGGCIEMINYVPAASGIDASIAYTPIAQYKIKALAAASVEYRLVFNGFNTADSDKSVIVSVHRVKFSAAQALDLITDDYGELPLDFEVLADGGRAVGDQFFTIKMTQ